MSSYNCEACKNKCNENDTIFSNKILKTILEMNNISILVTDKFSKIIYVNEKFTENSGYSFLEIVGKNPSFLQSGYTPRHIYHEMWSDLNNKKAWNGVLINRDKFGFEYLEDTTIFPVLDDNELVEYYIACKKNISDSKDYLTGLLNKRGFIEFLNAKVMSSQRYFDDDFTLFYMDLDGFKNVNDSYGHNEGDNILKQVSRRLEDCIRKSDILARLGGDEFAIIYNKLTDESELIKKSNEIISKISDFYEITDSFEKIPLGISIGAVVYNYSKNSISLDELISQADAAMYEAKSIGKNKFVLEES